VVAIKESSENPRRLTDIVNLTGDRYALFCGVDDLVLESVLLGAVGWVSGLVNVFPKESVRLWELAVKGDWERARAIYRWFMPTLHLDTSPKLVQMIKLGQKIVGNGSAVTRAPRLALEGEELARVTRLYEEAIANRPTL
jgi:1-pyrroline-4-hydroxy-2-carboxylate deaminase